MKPVCKVIGKALGTVAQHIAVQIIAHCIAVELNQSVADIILEVAVRRVGNVARCVIGIAFLRQYSIIGILLRSLCDPAQVIISITQLRIIRKVLLKTAAPKGAAEAISYFP